MLYVNFIITVIIDSKNNRPYFRNISRNMANDKFAGW